MCTSPDNNGTEDRTRRELSAGIVKLRAFKRRHFLHEGSTPHMEIADHMAIVEDLQHDPTISGTALYIPSRSEVLDLWHPDILLA